MNLIISGDSVIGKKIHERVGGLVTTRRTVKNPNAVLFDLRWPTWLPEAETTYLCSGIGGFVPVETDPETAWWVNVKGTIDAAKMMAAKGSKLVLLSSCAAETHPERLYGKYKRETEDGVLALGGCAFRFGPVNWPGRKTWPNMGYHPIDIEPLIDVLTGPFVPGLHKVHNTPVVPA